MSLQAGSRAQNYQLGVHRAVPVRPQHHRRRRRLQARRSATSASSRRSRPAATSTFGLPAGRLHADVRQLQLRARRRSRTSTRSTRDPRVLRATRSCATRCCIGAGRRAHDQQGHAELRLQHGRQPDLPDHRASGSPLSIDLAGLGGNTNFFKPTRRGRLVPRSRTRRTSLGFRAQVEYIQPFGGTERRCRSSRSCSSAASTASAASTSGRSARATRSPASCSAATRACCSTSST